MVTVHRAQGLRIVIFVDDHAPAHVHVFGDGEAKIDLKVDSGRPALVWSYAMSRSEVRRAMRMVNEQQAALLAKWESIHGGTD